MPTPNKPLVRRRDFLKGAAAVIGAIAGVRVSIGSNMNHAVAEYREMRRRREIQMVKSIEDGFWSTPEPVTFHGIPIKWVSDLSRRGSYVVITPGEDPRTV